MNLIIGNKPKYKIEQPFAIFEIDPTAKKHGNFPEDFISSKLSRVLADEIYKKMVVVKYEKSVITGAVYDGFNNYAPHTDPLTSTVFEAYLLLFNDLQTRIEYLERELEKRRAYENYYK